MNLKNFSLTYLFSKPQVDDYKTIMQFSKMGAILSIVSVLFVAVRFFQYSTLLDLWIFLSLINYSAQLLISLKFNKDRFGTVTPFFKRMVLFYSLASAVPWALFPWLLYHADNVSSADRIFAVIICASVAWGAVFMVSRIFFITMIYTVGVTFSLVIYIQFSNDPLVTNLTGWILTFQAIVVMFGILTGVVGRDRDVTFFNLKKTNEKLIASEQRANQIAYTDAVTGLANRAAFNRDLEEASQHSTQSSAPILLAVLDLNLFKNINDSHGHQTGDRVLCEVANRIIARTEVSNVWEAYRLGGDEFGLLAHNVRFNHAQSTLEAIIEDIGRSYEFETVRIDMSCSAGFAAFPDQPVHHLFYAAELALRHAKTLKRNAVVCFDDKLESANEDLLWMDSEIRRNIDQDLIEILYQPQISFKSQTICGIEVLCRLRSARGEFLNLQKVFEVAESRGLTQAVSAKIFQLLEKDFPLLFEKLPPGVTISVNISPADLRSPNQLLEQLTRWKQLGLPTARIRIEITEACLVGRGSDSSTETLNRIASMGYSLSLDDFGTGFASLTHLRHLPIDELKIDKEFLDEINDNRNEAILVGILQMTHQMGIQCVVEGIETLEQFLKLRFMDAEIGQGYFWSPKITRDELLQKYGQRSLETQEDQPSALAATTTRHP